MNQSLNQSTAEGLHERYDLEAMQEGSIPQILELLLAFWLLTKEVSVSKWYPSITSVLPEFVHRGGGQSQAVPIAQSTHAAFFLFLSEMIIYNGADNSVFSLHFSLAGKGPFLTGKAKNVFQRRTLLPGEGLRVHEGFYFRASSQPIDRKVFLTPQNKEFYE